MAQKALYVKVGLIGAFDMLKFKNQPKVRARRIARASAAPLPEEYGTNARAAALHPKTQALAVTEVLQHGPDVKSYVLRREDGMPAAYFRAGQYLSLQLEIDGAAITRPYSISSSPDYAREGKYLLTIKRADGGFASGYILDHWVVGTKVTASGPEGLFYYEPLRDAKRVVGLAGGSGITPFLSMAYAIRDGAEDFELTILYGSRRRGDVLFEKEFAEIAAQTSGRVKLVDVLCDEQAEGCESGYLTAELISKYAGEGPYSVFLCGPQAMYRFFDGELPKLSVEPKFVRRELFGAEKQPWTLPGYPADARGKEFKLTVKNCGRVYELRASADEPVLVAIERAGVKAPSRCRSGECGYCHSKLVSGDVFVSEATDGRRRADKVFGYIHPCVTYPLSDLTIELPGAY